MKKAFVFIACILVLLTIQGLIHTQIGYPGLSIIKVIGNVKHNVFIDPWGNRYKIIGKDIFVNDNEYQVNNNVKTMISPGIDGKFNCDYYQPKGCNITLIDDIVIQLLPTGKIIYYNHKIYNYHYLPLSLIYRIIYAHIDHQGIEIECFSD